jgi:hypothetical protein
MPFRNRTPASRTRSTDATARAFAINQVRARTRSRSAQSRATTSKASAIASGSVETSAKKIHSATNSELDGSVSEIAFNARGMKAPGVGEHGSGTRDRDRRGRGDFSHTAHHAVDLLPLEGPVPRSRDVGEQHAREHDVEHGHPGLR